MDLDSLYDINFVLPKICIHLQPQHQNLCLISRHNIQNPLPPWTLSPMSSLCQRHVTSHWTAILQKVLISCLNILYQDLTLCTHTDSLIAPPHIIKIKNTNTTMDISLIYYHLLNKENLYTIGYFLPEKIPHTIYNIFHAFLSSHQWYWLTVQYHGDEGSTPVNLSVKGGDLI